MALSRAAERWSRWIALAPICLAAATGQPAPLRQPHGRAELRARALIDQRGQYAGPQYQAALRARLRMLKQQSSPSNPGALGWTELGPGNIGGRLNAIWVDPANAQHLLVGSASGGLWQSSDGGSTWSQVSEFPGALTIGAVGQLPSGTLLVGTGDVFTAGGDGMFSSTDGGATWTPISSTAPQTSGSFWLTINSIATASSATFSSGVALAATYGGIARSTDGGQTWTPVWTGSKTSSWNSMDVVFDPENSNDAVADDENGGVVYSVDGGQNWLTTATGLPGTSGARVSLAFDPSVAGSVYALVDNHDGSSPSGEIYHSTDGGASWALLAGTGAFVNSDSGSAVGALCDNATGGTPECQGSYDNVIVVEPHASGTQPTILVGGIDIFASTDGGTTWTETGSWLPPDPNYLHADQHAFTYVTPSGPLYVGNDGGFYVQKTASTWLEQNEGLAVTQFYSVSGHKGTTSTLNVVGGTQVTPIAGGTQDNGTLLYEGYSSGGAPQPDDWVSIYGGDGGVTLVDPADGNDLYGEYVYLALGYSSDGGQTDQGYATEPADSAAKAANFIAPFVLVPTGGANANQMIAGGASVWLGTNIQTANPTWTAINQTGMPASTTGSDYVSAIAVDSANGNDVWVGYDDGEIWHSINALGATPVWTRVVAVGFPVRQVESLWIVPGQSSTIYATFGGYPTLGGASNVWVTTDGGGTWTDVGSGLPGAPVYSLITHPAYPQILYAGTLTGVYTSLDGGQTWNTTSLGPANVEVRQLSWFDTSSPDAPTLLAATFGRGAWLGSPAYNPTPTLTSISPAEVTVGSPDTQVTLTGSGFVQGTSSVTLDSHAISATYQSGTTLGVTVPASTLAVLGTHTFIVSNPIPGGGTSSGANLTVGNPAPVLDSISPASAKAGASELTLTLAGSGFEPTSVVEWSGAALTTTYVSPTSLTAELPSSDLSTAGQAQVTVVTAQPGGGTSTAVAFTVDAAGGGGALGDLALLLLLGLNVWTWARSRADP